MKNTPKQFHRFPLGPFPRPRLKLQDSCLGIKQTTGVENGGTEISHSLVHTGSEIEMDIQSLIEDLGEGLQIWSSKVTQTRSRNVGLRLKQKYVLSKRKNALGKQKNTLSKRVENF